MKKWLTALFVVAATLAASAQTPQPIYSGLNNNGGMGSIGNIGLLQIGLSGGGGGGGCAGVIDLSTGCTLGVLP